MRVARWAMRSCKHRTAPGPGLVWPLDTQPRFGALRGPEGARWGVFHFTVLQPIKDMNDLRTAFAAMLPALQMLYDRTRRTG
jgi:hypothetical protein